MAVAPPAASKDARAKAARASSVVGRRAARFAARRSPLQVPTRRCLRKIRRGASGDGASSSELASGLPLQSPSDALSTVSTPSAMPCCHRSQSLFSCSAASAPASPSAHSWGSCILFRCSNRLRRALVAVREKLVDSMSSANDFEISRASTLAAASAPHTSSSVVGSVRIVQSCAPPPLLRPMSPSSFLISA
jgi:hypothetical protein